MGLRINNNIASINGRNNMLRNDMAVSKSLEKLSSGLRINRASDDAAGLVISEQMRAQIAGINQAIDNSETAISMVQTAEGALDEVNNLLNKARELVLHAANAGANDANQLAADQSELDNVIASVSRISDVTQFGTKKLLDGTLDGSSSLSSGLNRVDAGNLSNNAAVATGTVSLQTSGFVFESQDLAGSAGAITDNGYVFGTSGISGVEELTSSTVINSGAVSSLTIDGSTYSVTTTATGNTTVAAAITSLNNLITGNFEATASTGGGITVARTDSGSTDFVSSFSFTKASGTTAQNASSEATITAVAGTNNAAASAVFVGASDLGDVTTSSVFATAGTVINAQVQTSTGTTNISYTVTGGATMQTALDKILSGAQGIASITGSSISFAATSGGGITVNLDTNDQTIAAINFSMEIDLPSSSTVDESISAFRLDTAGGADGNAAAEALEAALFTASGGSGLENSGTVAGTSLNGNTVMNLDVDGQSFVVTGGVTLAAAVTDLQGQLDAAFGANVIRIVAISGVETGDTAFGMDLTGTDTLVTGMQILISRNDNSTTSLTGATLSFENTAVTGTDTVVTNVEINSGSGTLGSSYNLDTSSQTSQSGATAAAAVTLASVTGSTTVTNGNVGVTATLTTANGVQLDLISSGTTSTGGGATLVLSSATGNASYQGIKIEIDGATAAAGTSNLSFSLDDGAVFQVGANAGQTVGLTIGDLDANELGRNVADSGTLSSLNDLLSTENSALTNGLADEALRVIDVAIDEVTNMRGDLGAFQANTLETGLSSLRVSGENLTAAESTIRDVDFALESATFARNNILIQASTAMLAQANQLPQNVLQLLG